MFIQTESTPNPNSLKFILDDYQLCESPIEFNKSQENTHSVLADELFKIYCLIRIVFQLIKMNIPGTSLKLLYYMLSQIISILDCQLLREKIITQMNLIAFNLIMKISK